MTQWTPTAIWGVREDPKVTFGRKFQTNALQREARRDLSVQGLRGAYPAARQVPADRRRRLPDPWLARPGRRPQRSARFGPWRQRHRVPVPELYREYYREEVWKDATYGSEITTEKVCTAVHVASGRLRELGRAAVHADDPGAPQAGYYQQTDSRDVPLDQRSRRACRSTRRWPASPCRAGNCCWPRACT